MLVVVGRIGRAHGLGGEVAVEVRTDEPERRFAVGSVLQPVTGQQAGSAIGPAQSGWPSMLTVAAVRWQSGRLLARFSELADRTAVEGLAGALLAAEVDITAPGSDPEEFHDLALVGLAVRDTVGADMGRVVGVTHLPGQDLLVVALADGGAEILVPFVSQIVPTVNLVGGFIVLEPPPGLIGAEEGADD